MTVEEYLRTAWEGPEPDYIDGEFVERHVGGNPHSKTQLKLMAVFLEVAKRQSLHLRPELTMRLGPNRLRVADFAAFIDEPAERFPSTPPLVIVEILSPDDRMSEVMTKLADYRHWGVKHIWLVDPDSRQMHVYGESGLTAVATLSIPEFGLEIGPSQLF